MCQTLDHVCFPKKYEFCKHLITYIFPKIWILSKSIITNFMEYKTFVQISQCQQILFVILTGNSVPSTSLSVKSKNLISKPTIYNDLRMAGWYCCSKSVPIPFIQQDLYLKRKPTKISKQLGLKLLLLNKSDFYSKNIQFILTL